MRGFKKAIIELLIFLMIVPLASIPIPAKAATAVAKKFEIIDKSKSVNIAANGELLDKRTQFSKTILKPDGSKEMQTSLAPINYQTQVNGKTAWQSIDSSLVAATTRSAGVSKTTYQNKANAFKVSIGQDILTDGVTVSQGGAQISLKPQRSFGVTNRSTLPLPVDGSLPNVSTQTKVTNDSVSQADTSAVSYTYKSTNVGLKETINLSNNPGKNVFYFDLGLQGLTYENKNGSIYFYAPGNKTPIFYVPPSYAYDANFMKGTTAEDFITYNVATDITKTNTGYTLKLTVDNTWLNSLSRKYPITIDPSIQYNVGDLKYEDSFVEQKYPSIKTWDQAFLYAGYGYVSGYNKGWMRTLLPFNTPDTLGNNVTVNSTKLTLYQRQNTADHGIFVRMTSDYSGDSTSWNSQPQYSGDTIYNQDRTTGDWINIDVTPYAKYWYEPRHDVGYKRGYLALTDDQDPFNDANPGKNFYRQWISMNGGSAPYLTIDYTDINVDYSFSNVHDTRVGDNYSFGVNVHNSGTAMMAAGDAKLEVVLYKDGQPVTGLLYGNLPGDVASNGTITVNLNDFTIKEPGNYEFRTDIHSDYFGWYSAWYIPQGHAYFTVNDYPEYGASYQIQGSVPSSAVSGSTLNLPINVQNLSRNDWPVGQYQMSYHWIDNVTGDMIFRDGIATSFQSTVGRRGAYGTANMQIKVPSNAGNYTLQIDGIQPGVTWFSDKGIPTSNFGITVTSAPISSKTRLGTESYYAKVGPVDLATGNLSYSSTDMTVGSNTGLLSVSRSYNSNSPDTLYDQSSDGYVQNWIVNGPYKENDYTQRLDKKYISNEETIRPNANSSTNGKVWFKATTDTQIPNEICGPVAPPVPRSKGATKSQSDSVVLDINKSLENIGAVQSGYAKNSIVYANTYVYSPVNQTVQISVGADDGYKVLLNGQSLFSNNVYFGCYLNGGSFTGNLKSGWNSLMVKVSNENNSWKMSTRISDSSGNAISGLKYSLDNQELFGDYETLGKGWTADFQERLFVTDLNNIYHRDSTGAVEMFTKNPDGTYASPTASNLKLTKNADATFSLVGKSGLKVNFNDDGKIVSKVDLSKNTLLYQYDLVGNCVKISDNNRNISLAYKGKQLNSITDALGNKYSYAYDSVNFPYKLISVTDPAGNFFLYNYNANNKLQTYTDKNGNKTVVTYSGDNKVINIQNALGNSTQFNFMSGKTEVTDALGRKSTAEFDQNNLLIAFKNAKTYREFYQYDGNFNLISTTPDIAENNYYFYRWSYTYDSNNNVITSTDPLNKTVTYQYAGNDLIKSTDPDGSISQFFYSTDGRRLLASQKDPKGNTSSYSYDSFGHCISTTDPENNTSKSTFSTDGDLATVTSPKGETIANTYDSIGRKLTEKTPLGKVTTYSYNNLNQLVKMADPAGLSIGYLYDKNNNLVKTINPDGTSKTSNYDAINQLIKSTDETGASIQYQYDAIGNKIKEIDANGKATTYQYDELGKLISQQDSSNATASVQYDRNNQPTVVTDPNNQKSTQTYDKSGQLTQVVDSENSTNVSYNPDGTIKTVGSSSVASRQSGTSENLSFEYDLNNNVTNTQSTMTGASAVTYNKNDSPTKVATQVATTSYSYDANGQIALISNNINNQTLTTRFVNDADGKLTSSYKPNSDTTFYTYDVSDRITQITNRNSGKTLLSQYNYKYDKNSNIIAIKDGKTGGLTSYTYDARGQLIGDGSNSYTYDLMGNRQSMTNPSGVAKYTYDTAGDANRLTKVQYPNGRTVQYQYDANGNLIKQIDSTQGTTLYAYDSDDYFTKAVMPDNSSVEYQYDKMLKLRMSRIETSASGQQVITKFLYSGDKLVSETDQNGKILRSYNWDNNEKLISVSLPDSSGALKTFTYQKDLKDDITQLTDQAGNIVAEYQYDAWGNILNSKTTAKSTIANIDKLNPRLYSSYWYDSTLGLYFMKTRMYNPVIGRFQSKDAQLAGGSALGTNPYIYCLNSPVSSIDPSGKGLLSKISQFASKVVQATKNAWDNMWSAIVVGVNNLANSNIPVLSSIAKTINKVSDWTEGKWYKAAVVGFGFAAAVGAAIVLAPVIVSSVSAAVSTAAGFVANTVSTAAMAVGAFANKVYNWVGGSGGISEVENTGYSSFNAAKNALGSPGAANDWHHIVEQSQVAKSGFSSNLINSTSNLISIPSGIHAKISGFYSSVQDFSDGLRVRDWLAGQSFEAQYKFGLEQINRFFQ